MGTVCGCGGGYAKITIAVKPGQAFNYVVGRGGAAGSGNISPGGTTSFGNSLSASGGNSGDGTSVNYTDVGSQNAQALTAGQGHGGAENVAGGIGGAVAGGASGTPAAGAGPGNMPGGGAANGAGGNGQIVISY